MGIERRAAAIRSRENFFILVSPSIFVPTRKAI
jgi:hypothetical protein